MIACEYEAIQVVNTFVTMLRADLQYIPNCPMNYA